ncbi:MAG: hypothetical protein JSS04_18115 [Proteobacteria bacterium]|nr:hypothetical protein [Pseudomonadota bacterium]
MAELEGSPALTYAWVDTRARIHELHAKAETSEERGLLLSMHIILMNSVELSGLVKDLEAFREERRKDYNRLLMSEATDGRNFVPAMLLEATQREIAVGHIDEDHEMHKLALAAAQVSPPKQASWFSRLFGC